MSSKNNDLYNEKFYRNQANGSYNSAKEVLKVLFQYIKPKSVVDVGCGVGTWLKACKDFGCEKVFGIDGNRIDEKFLYIPRNEIEVADLENYKNIDNKTFDMAMSLEVAEHLKESSADNFVDLLCSFSDLILFSAAIPYQGGTNHINCQPLNYWSKKFAKNGYLCFDFLREKIYDNDKISWWYSQNVLIFAKDKAANLLKSSGFNSIDNPITFYHKKFFTDLYNSKNKKRKGIFRRIFKWYKHD